MARSRENTEERNKQLNSRYDELMNVRIEVPVPNSDKKAYLRPDHDDVIKQVASEFFLEESTVDKILSGAYDRMWQNRDNSAGSDTDDPDQLTIFDELKRQDGGE
jgi:hypothetical protein